MQFKTSLTSLIYDKILSAPLSSLSKTTTGKLVNIISTDVEKFMFFPMFSVYLFHAPFEALVAYFLLANEIGLTPASISFACLLFTSTTGFLHDKCVSVCVCV